MKRFSITVVVGASFLLAGCPNQIRPELTNRYATLSNPTTAEPVITSALSVTTTPSESKPKAGAPITELGERGQAALITALAKYRDTNNNPVKPDDMLKLLGQQWTKQQAKAVLNDTSLMTRKVRLVINVKSDQTNPGDRIAKVDNVISLQPYNGSSESPLFKGWDKYETKHGEVDLGKITHTQSNKRTASTKVDIGNIISEISPLELSSESNAGLQEELTLARRYIVLGGILGDYEATLFQEGTSRIDLAGAIAVDVTIGLLGEPDAASVTTFKADSATAAGTFGRYSQYLPYACDVKAKLATTAVVRKIITGANSIAEGDDTIKLVTTSDLDNPYRVIIPRSDIEKIYFQVLFTSGPDNEAVPVESKPYGDGVQSPMNFTSYPQAMAFMRWLQARMRPGATQGAVKGVDSEFHVHVPGTVADTRALTNADMGNLSVQAEVVNACPF